ncbi:MAG: hypothetical protein HN584_04465 [Akkermansiaceae bacterium]|jgi:hypothetical protein|nr:hypothetical protein [Akkermansiaceae bacterium]MDG1855055.1 hypothetical protein [Verrucomicrobiales bacterium]
MTSITKLSILIGSLLTALGVALYFSTGKASVTALIPSFIGIPILICGVLAKDEKKRKVVAHIALTLALLGALAGYGRGLPKLFGGDSGTAILGMLAMSVICTVYVIACVRSFIAARKS